jgi:DNA-binding CsgD family transcriptional regulator
MKRRISFGSMLDPTAAARSANRNLQSLSPRERAVLELTARGMANAKMATELGVTVHAVKFHLASIYRKLGVENRTEAAAAFLESRIPLDDHNHQPGGAV